MLPQGFAWSQVVLLGAGHNCPDSSNNNHATLFASVRMKRHLEELCRLERYGCRVAQPEDDLIDYATGEVQPYFWSRPADSHCAPLRVVFYWHRAIQRATTGLRWCEGSGSASGFPRDQRRNIAAR